MELESALLIVPPRKVQAFAYPLRERYDTASFERMPAHITLLYPFASPDAIDQAVERLTPICAGFPPFELTLDRYGRFPDTLFLEPTNPEPILGLYERLVAAFPEYPPYEGDHGQELRPHMTLARFDDPAEGEAIELPPTPSFTFTVKQLHIYVGSVEDDAPFIPRALVPLGTEP